MPFNNQASRGGRTHVCEASAAAPEARKEFRHLGRRLNVAKMRVQAKIQPALSKSSPRPAGLSRRLAP